MIVSIKAPGRKLNIKEVTDMVSAFCKIRSVATTPSGKAYVEISGRRRAARLSAMLKNKVIDGVKLEVSGAAGPLPSILGMTHLGLVRLI